MPTIPITIYNINTTKPQLCSEMSTASEVISFHRRTQFYYYVHTYNSTVSYKIYMLRKSISLMFILPNRVLLYSVICSL